LLVFLRRFLRIHERKVTTSPRARGDRLSSITPL
jgi:hypothetical protein